MDSTSHLPHQEHSTESARFPVTVANFYQFCSIAPQTLVTLKQALDSAAATSGLLGLAVIAPEGVNCTLAGSDAAVREGISIIESQCGITLEPKWSGAPKQPFFRWKVDVRKEIVTLGFSCEHERSPAESFLTPQQWHERLSRPAEERPVVIDFRNDYETLIGKFVGAEDPGFEMFTDLHQYVEQRPELKEKELLVYCTGGIRCEKAVPFLRSKGFKDVKQLHGGILKYLEAYPEGTFEGECFVFDHRVAVDGKLQPTKQYWLCPLCGDPGNVVERCDNCGKSAHLCQKCAAQTHACSKNCRHHLGLRGKTVKDTD